MKRSVFTTKQIYDEVKRLNHKVDELEEGMRHLRAGSNNWETGIEKDTRLSVKLLYDALKDARNDLDHYYSIEVTVTGFSDFREA